MCPDEHGIAGPDVGRGLGADHALPGVAVEDLRIVDDRTEHDQPPLAFFLEGEGLVELAQGQPDAHAETRCAGAKNIHGLSPYTVSRESRRGTGKRCLPAWPQRNRVRRSRMV